MSEISQQNQFKRYDVKEAEAIARVLLPPPSVLDSLGRYYGRQSTATQDMQRLLLYSVDSDRERLLSFERWMRDHMHLLWPEQLSPDE